VRLPQALPSMHEPGWPGWRTAFSLDGGAESPAASSRLKAANRRPGVVAAQDFALRPAIPHLRAGYPIGSAPLTTTLLTAAARGGLEPGSGT
jgi:hypothetical protein